MRAVLLAAALLLPAGAAAADPIAAIEQHQQALFSKIAPSVVYVGNTGSFGSGFFVSGDGLILTNAHVIGEGEKVTVVLHDGRKAEGRVVERAADDTDLALVKIDVKNVPALKLGGGGLRVGSWVASVGHGMGGVWTFTTGMVSNIYPLEGDRPVFQTQIPLNPGNSGGPIVDREGRVVGIVTAGIVESNSINFAIRAEVAMRTLQALQGSCECLVITAPEGIPVLVDGRMAGKGPRVVVPATKRTYRVQAVIGGKMKQVDAAFPARREVRLDE